MGWSNRLEHSDTVFYALSLLLYVGGILLAPSLWMVVAVLALWRLFLKRRPLHWFKTLLLLGLIFLIIIESALVSYIMQANKAAYTFNGSETMIIPGAAVVGEQPGSFLRARLEVALKILETHETMPVVVSGGKSPEDDLGEAEAMRSYLEKNGIAANRIYEEDQSYDTIRNLEYSKVVIQENDLSLDVVIISNEFHNFRIKSIARTIGLNPVTVAAPTPKEQLWRYMVREVASLLKVQLHYGLRLKVA